MLFLRSHGGKAGVEPEVENLETSKTNGTNRGKHLAAEQQKHNKASREAVQRNQLTNKATNGKS
jgi:hypothetical protein